MYPVICSILVLELYERKRVSKNESSSSLSLRSARLLRSRDVVAQSRPSTTSVSLRDGFIARVVAQVSIIWQQGTAVLVAYSSCRKSFLRFQHSGGSDYFSGAELLFAQQHRVTCRRLPVTSMVSSTARRHARRLRNCWRWALLTCIKTRHELGGYDCQSCLNTAGTRRTQ